MTEQEILTALHDGVRIRYLPREVSGVPGIQGIRDLWIGRNQLFGGNECETGLALEKLIRQGEIREITTQDIISYSLAD